MAKENSPIAFVDLKAQQARIRTQIDAAIARVLDHGNYIMGPEIGELEKQLAAFCGAGHAISCSSGTDALMMVLMAKDIGPGDAIICPAFTYTATPEVISILGAAPVFSDVDRESFNLDPAALSGAIETARQKGLRPRGIIAVDLFGQPADYDAIARIAEDDGLFVLADGAQSFGATSKRGNVGQLGTATATSFFPAKPLGCYGDGGAVFTDDDELAAKLDSIRLHGKGAEKYDAARVGINGRLDTVQAAVLIEKLKIFPDEIIRRQEIAGRYTDGLANYVSVPGVADGATSVWAQYTLKIPADKRRSIAAALKKEGIPTQIYYPQPLTRQAAYANCPVAAGGVPNAERLSQEVLSLPMHPYLSDVDQDRIIDAVRSAARG